MKTTLKLALLASSSLFASSAWAQQQPTPPEHYTLDARGVDQVNGTFNHSVTDVAIGVPGKGGISHGRVWTNGGWRDTLAGTIAVTGSKYYVSLGGKSEVFEKSGSNFVSLSNNGSTLVQSGNALTHTHADGTIATYSTSYSGSLSPYQANNAALMSVVSPNGERLNYHWSGATYCGGYSEIDFDGNPSGDCLQYRNAVRLEGVSNNYGYAIDYIYETDTPPEYGFEESTSWLRRTAVRAVNTAVDPCSTYPSGCETFTQAWPSVVYISGAYGGNITRTTDQSGNKTEYGYTGGNLSSIRLPGSDVNDVAISYVSGKVASVTTASGVWNYSYADSSSTRTTTATGPSDQSRTVVSDLTIGRATSVTEVVSTATAL